MTAISEELSDERKHSPELVAALLNLKAKLEALPEPLRGPFVVEGLKPYLRSGNGGEVRVKALEWSSTIEGAEFAGGLYSEAQSPLGVYMAWGSGMWRGPSSGASKHVGDIATAKAAAQADYETRILSALDIKP